MGRPRARKGFLILLVFGVVLLLVDAGQRWVYLNWLPDLPEQVQRGELDDDRVSRSLLVAGAGLDRAESATGLRDLDTARASILDRFEGPHLMRILYPGQKDFDAQAFQRFLADSDDCKRLIVYLTGHGGGFNFGATVEFNLKTQAILKSLAAVEDTEILLVVDCCWSGRFQIEAEKMEFGSPITIITSTDEKHPSPFPISFLSPRSFGSTFFRNLALGEQEAFDQTNRTRKKLDLFFPEIMGLTGQRSEKNARLKQAPQTPTNLR